MSSFKTKIEKLARYINLSLLTDCLKFIVVLFPALISKFFVRNLWIISETGDEARDNGYWFFKWIKENKPHQKVIYVINRNSPDYKKASRLGKCVDNHSLQHWFYYILSEKKISTVKGSNPNTLIWYIFEIIFKIPNKRYFLQHGITKDDMRNLYFDQCRYRLFVCGAKPEYEFVREHFGYPNGSVKYLGFCRFDNLNKKVDVKKQILVMPTWREWIDLENRVGDFEKTDYYLKWRDFLVDEELSELLKKNDLQLVFFPHKNMERFIRSFEKIKKERITIAKREKYDIQRLLMESMILVTDYSSVFFDFAYMRKPVIFYQFDEDEFREKHYKKGYFDYHDNPLGNSYIDKNKVIDELSALLEGDNYKDETDAFFALRDSENCKRTYYAIKKM